MTNLKILGDALKADREALRHTLDSLIAEIHAKTGVKVSKSTLRRAEGGYCSEKNLLVICDALGLQISRYIDDTVDAPKWSTSFNMSGHWKAYFLESDKDTAPYATVESLYIKQEENKLTGAYEVDRSEHPDGWKRSSVFRMEAEVAMNVIFGRYYVDGRRGPAGIGVFSLSILPTGDNAEGYCTVVHDDGRISCSRNVWIRMNQPDFRRMSKFALDAVKLGPYDKTSFLL